MEKDIVFFDEQNKTLAYMLIVHEELIDTQRHLIVCKEEW